MRRRAHDTSRPFPGDEDEARSLSLGDHREHGALHAPVATETEVAEEEHVVPVGGRVDLKKGVSQGSFQATGRTGRDMSDLHSPRLPQLLSGTCDVSGSGSVTADGDERLENSPPGGRRGTMRSNESPLTSGRSAAPAPIPKRDRLRLAFPRREDLAEKGRASTVLLAGH